MPKRAPLNILIVGCSVAGPALATFLLLSSSLPPEEIPHITLLERAPALREDGQNIDIRGAGVTLIRKLGLEPLIRASTTGEEGVQWVGSDDGVWATFRADKSGETSTPTADIEIMRGRLAELLYKRCKTVSEEVRKAGIASGGGGGGGDGDGQGGVEFIFGDHIDQIEQEGDGVMVHFAKSGTKRRFDIVVGADGLQSTTRKMVWGAEGSAQEEHMVKRLGMYAGFFSIPKGKSDTQWRRWFHAAGRRSIMIRPDEQRGRTSVVLAVVNHQDERLPALASSSSARRRRAEDVQAQKDILTEYFRDAGWESERILREMATTPDFYYDMVAQVKMDSWSKGRVVLLGDAGYCASPLSGMGTTLALTGAYNLASALLQHPDDYTSAFASYEEKMRPVVDRAQKLAPGMPHLLHPETAWGVWVLNTIMYLLNVSRLSLLMFKLGAGPPAHSVPVEEYGFRDLPEMLE